MAGAEHVQDLMRLVEKLERDARYAARKCGAGGFETLAVTAEQYVNLYRDLRARGETER